MNNNGETKGDFVLENSISIVSGDQIDPGNYKILPPLVVENELILEPNQIHAYESVLVKNNGTITTESYSKNKSNGILRLYSLGTLIIENGGKIDVSGMGWYGGKNCGLPSDGMDAQGMSISEELGKAVMQPNNGGGGGGKRSSKFGSIAGGGGGYGSKGNNAEANKYSGQNNKGGEGGEVYSDVYLTEGLLLGSGGGSGSLYSNREPDKNKHPHGGHGGGAIELIAMEIVVHQGGQILANGNPGKNGQTQYASGGGGGSGGTILLRTPKLINRGKITAIGGFGGEPGSSNNCKGINSSGGNGGYGRIRINANECEGIPQQYLNNSLISESICKDRMISKIKTMKDVYDTIKEGGIIPSPKIEPCEIAFEMSDQFNALYFKLVQASEILYQFTRNQAEETKQQEETNETKNAESKLKKENPGETKDMKNTKQDQQDTLQTENVRIDFKENIDYTKEIIITHDLMNRLKEYSILISNTLILLKETNAAGAKEKVMQSKIKTKMMNIEMQLKTNTVGYDAGVKEKNRLNKLKKMNSTIFKLKEQVKVLKQRPLCSALQLHSEYKRIRTRRIVKDNIDRLPLPKGIVPLLQEMKKLDELYKNNVPKSTTKIKQKRIQLKKIQATIRKLALDGRHSPHTTNLTINECKNERNELKMDFVKLLHSSLFIHCEDINCKNRATQLRTMINTFENNLNLIENIKVMYTQRTENWGPGKSKPNKRNHEEREGERKRERAISEENTVDLVNNYKALDRENHREGETKKSSKTKTNKTAKVSPFTPSKPELSDSLMLMLAVEKEDQILQSVPVDTVSVSVNKALSSFEIWRSKSLKSKVVHKTDTAMNQYRGTLHLHLQEGLCDVNEDQNKNDDTWNTYSTEKLHILMMKTFDQLKKEDKAWTDKNPLYYLPIQIIRDATVSIIQLLTTETEILYELADYYQYQEEPLEMVAQLKNSRLQFKKRRRELRRIKLDLLDAKEIMEEEKQQAEENNEATKNQNSMKARSASVTTDEYNSLLAQKKKAETNIRVVDNQVHTVQASLAALERHWPEVSGVLGTLGIPKELLSLWRADRHSDHHYDTYEPLENVIARPGNSIMKATRDNNITVVKEYSFVNNKSFHTSLKEARILHRLRHPNIVEMISLFKLDRHQGPVFCIEMPYYKFGRLDHFLENEKPDASAVKRIFLDVLHAISHLHVHGIVHRDIKPGNILISDDGKPRLSDFDISVETQHRTTMQYTQNLRTSTPDTTSSISATSTSFLRQCSQGTQDYMAPELTYGPATFASDMYAFGITMNEVTDPMYNQDDEQLIHLIHLLKDPEIIQRPTAEAATNHSYFHDAWQWKRDERRNCCICFDEFFLSEGVECTQTSTKGGYHFTCSDCMSQHVDNESTAALRDIVKRSARIFCPMLCEGCTSECYPDTLLASQLRNKPTSLARYFNARKRLLESQASEQADERIKIELDRLIHMDENERIIYSKRKHVTETILNCCCPRCNQVFLDFSDCFAVKCSRCPCGFCAWCLADCGADAHEHVKQCPFKTNTDDYFGSQEEFDAAQTRRRIRDLRTFLKEIKDPKLSQDVLNAIRQDLKGVDLEDEFFSDETKNEKDGKEEKFEPPKCQQGHVMIISSYEGGGYRQGYICDTCKGRSQNGHCNGSRERWFCQACTADYCFECQPKENLNPKGNWKYKVTNRASANGHNVRKQPNLESEIVRSIQRGDEIVVTEVQGDWLKIEKKKEWVLSKLGNVIYLELVKGNRLPRRSENDDVSIELNADDVNLAIVEKRLIQLKDQINIKVNDDVVWKRGNQYHNRQMVNGTKDKGVDGSFVATKIKKKNVNGWGKDTAVDLPENKFACVKDESGWGKKMGVLWVYTD